MRVLKIADVADNRTGGMSRVMYGTGDALAAMGHSVDYLFRNDLPASGPEKLRRFIVPLRLPRLVRQLAKAGRRYDVVEIHEPMAAPYCLARQSHRQLPPVTALSHGIEERVRLLELAYKQRKNLPVSLKQRYSPFSVVFQAMYALRHASHVLCSNQEDIEYLVRAGVPAQHLTRHFNGVDAAFLAAGQCLARTEQETTNLLFVGSWLLRKGILDVVPAISEALSRHPNARFTIAGCSVSAEAVLQNFAPELHTRIQVVPKIDSDAVLIDIYRRHGLFVLPSYAEGQPLVMVEAAAMGLAIVTTRVAGMCDFVEHGCSGLLLPVGDSQALAQGLIELMKDPARVRKLGQAARHTATTHTWHASAVNMLQAYEKAMNAA